MWTHAGRLTHTTPRINEYAHTAGAETVAVTLSVDMGMSWPAAQAALAEAEQLAKERGDPWLPAK